ncbi:MAG: HDIG domain-containing protein [Magnetococcales bacterium]|nr:HDIG domain-containing protein [Magnetococcales bacterium]
MNERTHHRPLPQLQMQQSKKFRFPILVDGTLFVLIVVFLALINSPAILRPTYLPEVGEIAKRDVKADRGILIEDVETTQKRREAAARAVLPTYDWDPGMVDPIIRQLEGAFTWLEKNRKSETPITGEDGRLEFSEHLEDEVSVKTWEAIESLTDVPQLITSIRNWLTEIRLQPVVSAKEVVKDLRDKEFNIHSITDNSISKFTHDSKLIDLAALRKKLGRNFKKHFKKISPTIRNWLLAEVHTQVRPNLVLNLAQTQINRQKAFSRVEAVFFQARRGQMIVREGMVVTDAIHLKIKSLSQDQWTGSIMFRMVGIAGILGLLLWFGRWFLLTTSWSFPTDRKTTYMLGFILLVSSLLSAASLTIGQGVAELLDLPMEMVAYLPQIALASSLASLTVGARAGIPGGSLMIGVILSFLVSLSANGGLPLFIYYFVGSLVGGAKLRVCRRRYDVLIVGLWVGLAQLLTMPVVELLAGNSPSWDWVIGGGMALISGLFVGLWGLALIPLLESLFNITTDSRLLELASGDHPLVKELSLRSPGTYHHSVMMGNLAEAAAESIKANPLLARVMALYHDIGKMKQPHYFVENQSGHNRHDNLAPSMSSKVIMSHVKYGVEMAQTHKLGGPILEAIMTHHGTSTLQYFYNRALNQAAKKGETVEIEDYRYHGPKPCSKEAGILMVADSVEAAARSLNNPSSAQVQSLIKRIISHKIAEGQLDECRLTLKDIGQIEEAFFRVLTLGFYHHRIEYPDQIKKRKERAEREQKGAGKPDKSTVAG